MTEGIYPLRMTIGRALPIVDIRLLGHSNLLLPNQIRIALRQNVADAENDLVYRELHPLVWLSRPGLAMPFGPEVLTYRVPNELQQQMPSAFASLFILGPVVDDLRDARKLWAEIELTVAAPQGEKELAVVGGLVVAGYPYMPSYLSPQGEAAANHGYPREMRVTWSLAGQGDGFIDDEVSRTQQLPTWQSSHHVLTIDPVRTRQLRLRLSDFGRRILTLRSWDQEAKKYKEHWAVALPVIYAFEYEEGASKAANLAAGMVCATQSNRQRGVSFFQPALDTGDGWNGAESGWLAQFGQAIYPFTPQSALLDPKSRRQYPILNNGKLLDEFFISNALSKDDKLFWLLAQRDEHPRCLAGIRINFPPNEVLEQLKITRPPVRLQVYEVDPLPGALLARIKPVLTNDRFGRLLADEIIQSARREVVLRFRRVTDCRHIYLVFTALEKGQIPVQLLRLVRSASVSLSMRPSRSRHVRALHFRITGRDLGEDYARIGNSGFSIAVDRIVAGEPRERLFFAHSLEQLIRSGAVRSLINTRVRATETHQTVVQPGSFVETRNIQRTSGWQRSECGKDVHPPGQWQDSQRLQPDGEHGFTIMGNEESRTHVRHVAGVPSTYRDKIEHMFPTLHRQTKPNDDILFENNGRIWAPWRNNNKTTMRKMTRVTGLWNVSIPPYWDGLMRRVNDKKDLGQIESALHEIIDRLFVINGGGVGTGRGVGLLVPNFSWSNNISSSGVATALQAHSRGTTGSVTLNARQSGYAYSQNLNTQATDSDGRTEYLKSLHTQEMRRSTTQDDARIRGAEIVWNRQVTDLLIGMIPLSLELPAFQDAGYRTTDEAVRVSFAGLGDDLTVDVWFEATEELVRDVD